MERSRDSTGGEGRIDTAGWCKRENMGRGLRDYLSVTNDVLFQRWICRRVPPMAKIGDEDVVGLNVVVTGCTSGIGKAAAVEFARRDCNLFLACRNAAKGEKLRQELLEKVATSSGAKRKNNFRVMILDLSDLDSVVFFAKNFNGMGGPLDILVNNAGVFAMSAPRSVCFGGYELHLLTNFLSNSLLTLLLLPSLLRAAGKGRPGKAKVIMVNSKLHQMCTGFNYDDPNYESPGSYNSKKAYAQSKLSQLLFTNALRTKLLDLKGGSKEQREAAERVQLMTLHPGNVTTDVVRTLPWVVQKAYGLIMPLFLLTPEEGARSTLFAATDSNAHEASREVMNYLNSNCQPVLPSNEARDPTEAIKLWDWTMKEIGHYLSKEVKGLFA